MHYLSYLKQLHETVKPKVYFEIGTESGASLSFANCTSIAVDPQFQLQADVSRNKPELHQYQGTSDDFFASKMLDRLGLKVDLAFLDGMHLFEYLLRDFMNIEKSMSKDGMLTMHDCVPFNAAVALRDWDRDMTKSWTGDVWKVIPILREYRPDLDVKVLDLAPTGLVVVTGFDPENTSLEIHYDEILSRFTQMTLDDFGLEAFALTVDLQVAPIATRAENAPETPAIMPRRIFSAWEGIPDKTQGGLSIAIKTSVPGPGKKQTWGDYHFARSLADAMVRQGHRVRIDSVKEWHHNTAGTDFDLVLSGDAVYVPQAGIPFVSWVIYPGRGDAYPPMQMSEAEHVFFASEPARLEYSKQNPTNSSSVLLQCFDPLIMYPDPTTKRDSIVFVGNNHFADASTRPIIEMALETDTDILLWGMGWRKHAAGRYLQGRYLENPEVGDAYRKARIVLCDHMPSMKKAGYMSNRIFDALASGAAVICDEIEGIPDEFSRYVTPCTSARDFKTAVEAIFAESSAKKKARAKLAQSMVAKHSFDARAREIVNRLRQTK
jgi:hypothetical protein